MAALTSPRNGTWLWHDTDTDRSALHARYAEWCESPEGRAAAMAAHKTNMDSYTFEGVPVGDGPAIDIHTIIVTYIALDSRIVEERKRADDAETKLRIVTKSVERARGDIDWAMSYLRDGEHGAIIE